MSGEKPVVVRPLQRVTSMQPPRGCGVLGHTQVPRRPRGAEPAASAERDPGASEGRGRGPCRCAAPAGRQDPSHRVTFPRQGRGIFP